MCELLRNRILVGVRVVGVSTRDVLIPASVFHCIKNGLLQIIGLLRFGQTIKYVDCYCVVESRGTVTAVVSRVV